MWAYRNCWSRSRFLSRLCSLLLSRAVALRWCKDSLTSLSDIRLWLLFLISISSVGRLYLVSWPSLSCRLAVSILSVLSPYRLSQKVTLCLIMSYVLCLIWLMKYMTCILCLILCRVSCGLMTLGACLAFRTCTCNLVTHVDSLCLVTTCHFWCILIPFGGNDIFDAFLFHLRNLHT